MIAGGVTTGESRHRAVTQEQRRLKTASGFDSAGLEHHVEHQYRTQQNGY
jgi:hypothetical protein